MNMAGVWIDATHDDAERRDEDADGEADADPAEDDDAVLAGGEEQREEEDEPEHADVQEQQDHGREQLCAATHGCMSMSANADIQGINSRVTSRSRWWP